MRRSASSAISAARRRALSLKPPSALACIRQAIRRNRNCLFEDFDSSPNTSRYFVLNAATLNPRNCSMAAIMARSIGVFSFSLAVNYTSMDALVP